MEWSQLGLLPCLWPGLRQPLLAGVCVYTPWRELRGLHGGDGHCGFKSPCTLTERGWGQLSDAAPVSLDLTQPLTTVCTTRRKWKEHRSAAPSSLALVTSQIKAETAITLRRNPTSLELLLQNSGPHRDIPTEDRRSTGLHPALAAPSLTPVLPPTETVAASMSWGKVLLVPALAPALSPKPFTQTV